MGRILVTTCIVLFIISMNGSCEANPYKSAKKYFDMVTSLFSGIAKINAAVAGKISTRLDSLKQEISNKLENINDNIENVKDKILETITDKLKDKISDKIDTLFEHIKDVESSFRVFYENFTNQTIMAKAELERFAYESTSFSKTGLPRTVEVMHESFISSDYTKNESVVSIIARNSEAADTMCVKGLSSQQLIYDLYNIVAKADAKALMVKLFAYDVFKEKEQDVTYEAIKIQTKEKHLKALNATFKMVKKFMQIASREVWRCDPQILRNGINYAKLPEIFQGYFINKADLTVVNKVHEPFGPFTTLVNMFTHKCSEFEDERIRCDTEICKAQPLNKVCRGHIRDCEFLVDDVQVCHAHADDDRRYVWAHLMDTEVYYADHSLYCPDTQGMIGNFPEQICYCNCESENQTELRYFSLRESTSDIELNKVVTGVQFLVDKYVFHIRIQQGVLSKQGAIVGNTEWKEVNHISIYELAISHKISKNIHKTLSKEGQKYRYEEWTEWYENDLVYTVHYNQKKIFLDDFDFNGNKLVTGLRFKQVNDALRLEVRMTPFDYASGKLDVDAPDQWKFNPKKTNDRLEVLLEAPGDPKLSKPSTVFSKSNSYIQFRRTDLRKDVGQNTIPFIDLQPVVTTWETPFPLSGVGLFHRHDEKTGGFLALKMHHFDYTPYISAE